MNYPLFRKLHARGVRTTELAQAIGCTRAHVTRVLDGTRKSPGLRAKLLLALKPDEIALLPWVDATPHHTDSAITTTFHVDLSAS